MRKIFAIVLGSLLVFGAAGVAAASSTIYWSGQGSENLPCSDGGHWVLTGKGITSATARINGVDYVMVQHGQGSWSADSVGRLGSSPNARVTYEGSARNPQFVLSHCNDGDGGYDPPDPY
jgi:hypothetical protein